MERTEVQLSVADEGRSATVTLPGGDLTGRVVREFVDVLESLVEDRALRVVVLTAASADFCTGAAADLDRIAVSPDPASVLAQLRPPVVAVVRGRCVSVGLELALAADVRLADPAATFAMPDVITGELPCWGGTQRLPRAIRPSAAVGMLLLGDALDARRAWTLGLLHGVHDDLDVVVDELVDRLGRAAPLALELAKEAVHRGAELPLRDGLRLEGDLNHLLASTHDRAEGLAAFFAKRPADFAGR
jgi:enoyl-CoA hydratase/carnithine racemase